MEYNAIFKEKPVGTHLLKNGSGLEATVTNFGARIISLKAVDIHGDVRDVVLGFDNVEDYFPENNLSDFGAVIGRYANRLAGGHIVVEDKEYHLPQNNGPNCLHGGPDGWQYKVYDVEEATEDRIVLTMTSPDGDNGFPGEVRVRVVYTLSNNGALRIDYQADCDKPTVINMTNHSYFNLNGDQCSPVLNHILQLDSDLYTPVDRELIPLGGFETVAGTPMDFRQAKAIGADIESDYEQLAIGSGYDHNWVLNGPRNLERPAAVLQSFLTGIQLEVYTDAPGVQVYTGNFLNGVVGKGGVRYQRRGAVCLETQQYPDSPNHCWPESTGRMTPDNPFKSTTIFKIKTI